MGTLKDLDRELAFTEKNKERLLAEYYGKYILVQGEEIIGSFDSYDRAASEGVRLFGIDGAFMVNLMLENEPANLVFKAAF